MASSRPTSRRRDASETSGQETGPTTESWRHRDPYAPLDRIDAPALARDLPEPERPEFVHLDAFPENMLSDGTGITAVLDIGYTALAGDRRLDPLAAAVYLEPPTSPCGTPRDQAVARSWLRSAGLFDLLEPARRWIAAYWSFAVDDAPLQEWCRSVLESTPRR